MFGTVTLKRLVQIVQTGTNFVHGFPPFLSDVEGWIISLTRLIVIAGRWLSECTFLCFRHARTKCDWDSHGKEAADPACYSASAHDPQNWWHSSSIRNVEQFCLKIVCLVQSRVLWDACRPCLSAEEITKWFGILRVVCLHLVSHPCCHVKIIFRKFPTCANCDGARNDVPETQFCAQLKNVL